MAAYIGGANIAKIGERGQTRGKGEMIGTDGIRLRTWGASARSAYALGATARSAYALGATARQAPPAHECYGATRKGCRLKPTATIERKRVRRPATTREGALDGTSAAKLGQRRCSEGRSCAALSFAPGLRRL